MNKLITLLTALGLILGSVPCIADEYDVPPVEVDDVLSPSEKPGSVDAKSDNDVKTPADDSSPSKSGNTVVRADASVIKAERSFPIAVICVLGALIISSGAFGVYLIYRRRKQSGK